MRILNNSPYLANMHAGVGIYKSLYIEPIYTELRETHTASQDMENHDPHRGLNLPGVLSCVLTFDATNVLDGHSLECAVTGQR